MNTFLVLGLPAAGKSSLATAIRREITGADSFYASRILRDNPRPSWFEYWSRGENAPDDEVADVLWRAYASMAAEVRTVLLDGYPRTTGQYRDFAQRGGTLRGVLELVADVATLQARNEVRLSERPVEQRAVDFHARAARESALISELHDVIPSGTRLLQLSTADRSLEECAALAIEFIKSSSE